MAREQKSERSVDDVRRPRESGSRFRVSARTNVWGIVSILLLIGLIATVFIAYNNSHDDSAEKYFFSPSSFLQGISNPVVVIEPGDYVLHYQSEKFAFIPYATRAFVLIDGVRIYSNNMSRFGVMVGSYEFTINGKNYYAQTTTQNGIQYEVITLEGAVVEVLTFPDINNVVKSFQGVTDVDSFFDAFSSISVFCRDYLTFQANFLNNMLPWNHVVSTSEYDVNFHDLWSEAEERNGFQPFLSVNIVYRLFRLFVLRSYVCSALLFQSFLIVY